MNALLIVCFPPLAAGVLLSWLTFQASAEDKPKPAGEKSKVLTLDPKDYLPFDSHAVVLTKEEVKSEEAQEAILKKDKGPPTSL